MFCWGIRRYLRFFQPSAELRFFDAFMTQRSSKIPKAIPTSFNEVEYKSRLEARFAEFLFNSGFDFQYEKPLPDSRQGYVPDFYLKRFDLYVEIKPKDLGEELDLFRKDINQSRFPWIWVDNLERGTWSVLSDNPEFISRVKVGSGASSGTMDISSEKMRFHVSHLDLFPQVKEA